MHGGIDLAAAVARLIGRRLELAEPIAIAVSGGPDSLALLLLAHTAFSARVRVLTVDHGLRPESASEAAAVAIRAAELGLACSILRWDGPPPQANIQATARTARYRLMGEWCAANSVAWLATAHHRDDQAETVLLRLARGSGSTGLSGIRPVRPLVPGVTLLRPLLDRPAAELAAVVAAAGWTALDDPSNRSARYDRTHARALLAASPWLDPAQLAASAAHLGEAEAALAWTAELAWSGRASIKAGAVTLDAAGLPAEIKRRLVVRALVTLAPFVKVRGAGIARMLDRLDVGKATALAGVAVSPGPPWRFALAKARRIVEREP